MSWVNKLQARWKVGSALKELIDNAWDATTFKKMGVVNKGTNIASDYLLFPTGPFTGESSDTQVNFAVESTIEDAQK